LSRQLRVSSLGAEKATTCIVDTCGFGLLDLVLLGVACGISARAFGFGFRDTALARLEPAYSSLRLCGKERLARRYFHERDACYLPCLGKSPIVGGRNASKVRR
jgi:hypothetical protein